MQALTRLSPRAVLDTVRRRQTLGKALAVTETAELRARPGSASDFAIIGGGIAGLAAAWLLERHGHRCLVLEARDRPGGRIHTLQLDGQPVEAGAARISDEHTLALSWITRFDLELEAMYPTKGRLVRLHDAGGRFRREVGRDAAWLSDHDVHHLVSHPQTWAHQTGSTLSLARRLARHSIQQPAWYRIRGGNARLPHAIARSLGDSISYRSIVRKIVRSRDRVEVTYHREGVEYTRPFDRCIVTVPLATQADIVFDPPLSAAKQELAASMRAQPALRSFAVVEDRSAIAAEQLCGFGCTSSGIEVWQPSFSSHAQRMTLVAYAQGDAVKSLKVDDSDRETRAAEIFELMFPGTMGKTRELDTYSWEADPWARGGQSLVHQQAPQLREALSAAEGRLHFAGEHTTGGWMDDALRSVGRVVEEVCAELA